MRGFKTLIALSTAGTNKLLNSVLPFPTCGFGDTGQEAWCRLLQCQGGRLIAQGAPRGERWVPIEMSPRRVCSPHRLCFSSRDVRNTAPSALLTPAAGQGWPHTAALCPCTQHSTTNLSQATRGTTPVSLKRSQKI